MKRMIRNLTFSALAVLFLVANHSATAQIQYKLDSKNSSMLVKGTSTIHDWEMAVENLQGAFTLQEDQDLDQLTTGHVLLDVESIKSERSLMNKKTYEALKEDDFPQIKAKVSQVTPNGNSGSVLLELTIAGKTQEVTDDFEFSAANGTITVQGVLDLRMSDFGVEPPVAMMGTIKTGDEIKVEYKLVYNK
ncbi:YceI family protein [Sunxiuqinia sp. sy24]|uniref:YceI family protein n=1 Tax=Sunxiuqinia sp. sy24 TaxID=3461495 RepID=UPI0040456CBB